MVENIDDFAGECYFQWFKFESIGFFEPHHHRALASHFGLERIKAFIHQFAELLERFAQLLADLQSLAERQRACRLTSSDGDPGGRVLRHCAGRVNAPVNADRRPNQKARDRFPGAGLILAMVDICR